jgi:hypothetical protein
MPLAHSVVVVAVVWRTVTITRQINVAAAMKTNQFRLL